MGDLLEHRRGPDRRRQPRGGRREADRKELAPLVLVVGDNKEMTEGAETVLATRSFAVATRVDVEQALEVLSALRPDLVLAAAADVTRLREELPRSLPVVVMDHEMREHPETLIDEIRRALRVRTISSPA